jgi:hypothetical protein
VIFLGSSQIQQFKNFTGVDLLGLDPIIIVSQILVEDLIVFHRIA